SNVFFVRGSNLQDYVTTVTPQVMVEHRGRLISGTLTGSLTGEHYVRNPGLDYIAPSIGTELNLDSVLAKIDRRAKLTISERFRATPQPLAFIGPQVGNDVPDNFVRGIQSARANTRTNMLKAMGSYELTQASSFNITYMHSIRQYGQQLATPDVGSFFNTTYQTITAGPQVRVTPFDILGLNYQYLQSDSSRGTNETSVNSGFSTQGGNITWNRVLTPTLTADASGGISEVKSGSTRSLQYVVNAQLEWEHQNASAKLLYSRSIFPSFFVVPSPLLSQVASLSASYKLTNHLSATGVVSYALNEAIGPVQLRYESRSESVSLNYTITRWLTGIATVRRSDFNTVRGGTDVAFDRNVVILSLRGTWD
ncbi:MAG TPA: hypothetical protein VJV04_01360, partial [Nitrospiraceae bacterium]|nr:hypothetical protein [Nitrospiraceae bacterium]